MTAQEKYNLAKAYYTGAENRPIDKEKAHELFLESAEAGYPYAMLRVAIRLYNNKQYSEAFRWFELFIANKNSSTKFNVLGQTYEYLGHMLILGLGVKPDRKRGVEYYRKAIETGTFTARKKLAYLYNGGGLENNVQEYLWVLNKKIDPSLIPVKGYSSKYYYHIIDRHLISAYFIMKGIGCKANPIEAVRIWKNIYEHNIKIANFNLAVAHYFGIGVNQDASKAIMYLSEIKDSDRLANQILSQIESGTLKYPEFHMYSPSIVSGSRLDADFLLLKNNVSEAIRIYESIHTGDAFYQLAVLYAMILEDKEKFDLFFNKALDLKYPHALYHKSLLNGADGLFRSPSLAYAFTIDSIIGMSFHKEPSLWDLIYTFESLYKNSGKLQDLNEDKREWVAKLRGKLSESLESERECLFDLCQLKERNILIRECQEYFYKELGKNQGNSIKYPAEVFTSYLNELLKDAHTICFHKGVSLKMLFHLDPRKTYFFVINDEQDHIIANFLIDLLGLANITIISNEGHLTNCDTLVYIPDIEQERTFESDIVANYVSLKEMLSYITENQHFKKAIVLFDRNTCCSLLTEVSTSRESLSKEGRIEKVIELSKDIFENIQSSTALVALNFDRPSEDVCFIKNDKQINVSYDTLQKHQYILSYELYSQAIQANEEQEIVRLGDIIEFRFNSDIRPNGDMVRCLSESDFHPTLLYTLKHKNQYTKEDNYIQIPVLKEYKGEHLFLKYKDGVQLNLQTEDTFCFPDYGSYALRLKEGSPVKTLDYLAYILMSEEANQYLGKITDKNGDFIIRELMYKKVAIYTNPDKQNEVVRTTLAKERMKMDNGVTYNIVVISDNKDLIQYIDKNDGISVFAKDQSYVDLYTRYIEDTNKEIIDAVVVDTDSPDYESVIEDFNEIRERDIHLYIITNNSDLQLSGRKKKAYFEDNNRIYCFRSDSEKYRLIESVREDLDSSKASQARIRSKYNDVFDAAGKLDEKYNLNISETIIQYIQNGCEIENAKNTAFDKLRDVCHKLLEIFAEKTVVPKLNPGAIASLLADGCYTHKIKKEKDITYVMVHNILDNTPGMAKALEYFCFIANKEVHGQQYSSRLGTSVLNILMEFIVRFYQIDIIDNKLELLGRDGGIAYIEDDYFKNDGKVFSVKVSDDGKYFYLATDVGNIGIHIQEKPGLTPGAKVRITSKVKQETLNKRIINGTNVILYIHSDGYQLVK